MTIICFTKLKPQGFSAEAPAEDKGYTCKIWEQLTHLSNFQLSLDTGTQRLFQNIPETTKFHKEFPAVVKMKLSWLGPVFLSCNEHSFIRLNLIYLPQ